MILYQKLGIRRRVRNCQNGRNSGYSCRDMATKFGQSRQERQACAGANGILPTICPVAPVWSHWTAWSMCVPSCGQGLSQRSRTCVDGKYGGEMCSERYDVQRQNCTQKVN